MSHRRHHHLHQHHHQHHHLPSDSRRVRASLTPEDAFRNCPTPPSPPADRRRSASLRRVSYRREDEDDDAAAASQAPKRKASPIRFPCDDEDKKGSSSREDHEKTMSSSPRISRQIQQPSHTQHQQGRESSSQHSQGSRQNLEGPKRHRSRLDRSVEKIDERIVTCDADDDVMGSLCATQHRPADGEIEGDTKSRKRKKVKKEKAKKKEMEQIDDQQLQHQEQNQQRHPREDPLHHKQAAQHRHQHQKKHQHRHQHQHEQNYDNHTDHTDHPHFHHNQNHPSRPQFHQQQHDPQYHRGHAPPSMTQMGAPRRRPSDESGRNKTGPFGDEFRQRDPECIQGYDRSRHRSNHSWSERSNDWSYEKSHERGFDESLERSFDERFGRCEGIAGRDRCGDASQDYSRGGRGDGTIGGGERYQSHGSFLHNFHSGGRDHYSHNQGFRNDGRFEREGLKSGERNNSLVKNQSRGSHRDGGRPLGRSEGRNSIEDGAPTQGESGRREMRDVGRGSGKRPSRKRTKMDEDDDDDVMASLCAKEHRPADDDDNDAGKKKKGGGRKRGPKLKPDDREGRPFGAMADEGDQRLSFEGRKMGGGDGSGRREGGERAGGVGIRGGRAREEMGIRGRDSEGKRDQSRTHRAVDSNRGSMGERGKGGDGEGRRDGEVRREREERRERNEKGVDYRAKKENERLMGGRPRGAGEVKMGRSEERRDRSSNGGAESKRKEKERSKDKERKDKGRSKDKERKKEKKGKSEEDVEKQGNILAWLQDVRPELNADEVEDKNAEEMGDEGKDSIVEEREEALIVSKGEDEMLQDEEDMNKEINIEIEDNIGDDQNEVSDEKNEDNDLETNQETIDESSTKNHRSDNDCVKSLEKENDEEDGKETRLESEDKEGMKDKHEHDNEASEKLSTEEIGETSTGVSRGKRARSLDAKGDDNENSIDGALEVPKASEMPKVNKPSLKLSSFVAPLPMKKDDIRRAREKRSKRAKSLESVFSDDEDDRREKRLLVERDRDTRERDEFRFPAPIPFHDRREKRSKRARSFESVLSDDDDDDSDRERKDSRTGSRRGGGEKRRDDGRRDAEERRRDAERRPSPFRVPPPSDRRHEKRRRKRAKSLESVLSDGDDDEDAEAKKDWRSTALVPWRRENWAVVAADEPKTKKEKKRSRKGYDPRPSQDLSAWAEWAGKLALVTNKRQIQTSWIFEADSASEDSAEEGLTEKEKKEKAARKERKRLKRERKKKLRKQAERLKLLPQNWEDWKKDRNYREGSIAPPDKPYGPFDDLDPEMDPDFWKGDKDGDDGVPLQKDYKTSKKPTPKNIEITNVTKEMLELEREIARGPYAFEAAATNDVPGRKDFDFRDYSGTGITHRRPADKERLMNDPFYRERQEAKMRQSKILRTGFTSWTSGGALSSGHVRYTAAHSSIPVDAGRQQGLNWYWDGERWSLKTDSAGTDSSSLASQMRNNPKAHGVPDSAVSASVEDESTKHFTVVDDIEAWENAVDEEEEAQDFDADDVWEKELLLSQNFLARKLEEEEEEVEERNEEERPREEETSAKSSAEEVEEGEVTDEMLRAEKEREAREALAKLTSQKVEIEGRPPRAPHPQHAFLSQCPFRLEDGTPAFNFQGLVIYCGNRNDVDWYCQRIMKDLNHMLESYAPLPAYAGLHCEWTPQLLKGYPENKVSLLSLCVSSDRCYLFHLSNMNPPGIPLSLRKILEDKRFVKVGHGVQEFLRKLGRDYRLLSAEEIVESSTADLLDLSVEVLGAPATFGPWPVRKLVEVLLDGMSIPKLKKYQSTSWSAFPLSKAQKTHAATLSYASLEIFMCLRMIQCDLKSYSALDLDSILPILNPPPPPPPPRPPSPPKVDNEVDTDDFEDGEVLSDEEAQKQKESVMKRREELRKKDEEERTKGGEGEKVGELEEAGEEDEDGDDEDKTEDSTQKVFLCSTTKLRLLQLEEERKRLDEEDKGKSHVATLPKPRHDARGGKFGRFGRKSQPKKESMLQKLVAEFHSQPTPAHGASASSTNDDGVSPVDKALSGLIGDIRNGGFGDWPIFITVLGLQEEKPAPRRRWSPSRFGARPGFDRGRWASYRRDTRDSRDTRSSRNDSRGHSTSSSRDANFRRARDAPDPASRYPPAPTPSSRDYHSFGRFWEDDRRASTTRRSIEDRRHGDADARRLPRHPSPKRRSYWEDDDYGDRHFFDSKTRRREESKESSQGREKEKDKPLPRLGGDYGFYLDEAGYDSDEDFNLKYQSYYDMIESTETPVENENDDKEKAKGDKGKKDAMKKDKKEKKEKKEKKGKIDESDASVKNDSKIPARTTEPRASTSDGRKIVIAPIKTRLIGGRVVPEKPQSPPKKTKKSKEAKEAKRNKKMKKTVAAQIASNLKFGPEDAEAVTLALKELSEKKKKKKKK